MNLILALTLLLQERNDVVVVVNTNVAASVEIGEYYCAKRGIPRSMICRVTAGSAETISWPEFRKTILEPLREFLKSRPDVLYVVPVYGVPVKTSEEKPENDGKGEDTVSKCVTGRDYACIDREIELLKQDHDLDGWIPSKTFRQERHITLDDQIYIVSRLDGPTPESAKALVDNALYGEAYGIEGVSFLDTRGMKEDGSYGSIDCEMKGIAKVYEKHKIEFTHDDTGPVIKLGTSPNVAHYWGWYTGDSVIDPNFKFNRGAVGAHLHSFSAGVLRSKTQTWTGPLVFHGITGSCGTVYEPLSVGFPYGTTFLDRFFQGYTFGESMQMANMYTSWMAVFVGDPLYAPYAPRRAEAQANNRKLSKEGVGILEAHLDKNELDAAEKLAAELAALPEVAGLPFLLREVRARKKKAAAGTIKDLRAQIAAAAWKKGLAISEWNFECNVGLGKSLVGDGSARAGADALLKALEIEPKSSEALHALGLAYVALKQMDDAAKAFRAAVDLDGHAPAARELGELLFKQRKYEEALKLLESAAPDPGLALTVAKCHLETKAPAKAVAVLEKAVATPIDSPDDVDVYAQCWELLLKANKAAGNAEKADVCSKMLAGLGVRRNAAKAKGLEKILDEGKPKAAALNDLKVYDDKFVGLPTLYLANGSAWEVEVYLLGPQAWSTRLRGVTGSTKPKTVELPAYPGKYRVLVIAKKGREVKSFYRDQEFEANKNYALAFDANLSLVLAAK